MLKIFINVLIIARNMPFKRGQDPKKTMGIGKQEKGFILGDLSTFKNKLLEGFVAGDIYIITHTSSRNAIGVCSGEKAVKVIKNWIKKHSYKKEWKDRWIWEPSIAYFNCEPTPFPEGGYLRHKYASKDKDPELEEELWIHSQTGDISFSRRQDMIVEL
jgi:hypothetical protein